MLTYHMVHMILNMFFFRFRQYQPEPLETAAPRLDHYGRELLIGFLKVRI